MTLLALLLALQAAQDIPEDEPAPKPHPAQIGPIFQYWLPRFGGSMRVDGTTTGTHLEFVHDLGMPDDAAIPMYGGGRIGGRFYQSHDWVGIAGVAEYWTRAWKGQEVLASDVTLGDSTFLQGTTAESRLTLTSVTLDIEISSSTTNFTLGGNLSVQVTAARLRMDTTFVHASETVATLCWGGGLFLEYRPVSFLLAGLSLKGFTNFGDAGETGIGDFKFYGGAEWGPLRLEGGFRILLYDHDRLEESLSFTMYGGYVLGSLTLRF